MGVPRGEAEAGVGLLATAGGLVEDGAVDLGDQNVVVAAAVGLGRGGGGAEGEGEELRLREKAEVDEGKRVQRETAVVGGGVHASGGGHGMGRNRSPERVL